MASPSAFADILREVVKALDDTRETEAQTVAKDALALVRDRVQNDKLKADGSSFGTYSGAVVPYWFYSNKPSNISGATQKALDKYGYFVSYADWRETNNLQNDQIDLTFTGEMWQSAYVTLGETSEGIATATIQFEQGENALKAGYHSERFGNILALSEDETEVLILSYKERRFEFLNALLA